MWDFFHHPVSFWLHPKNPGSPLLATQLISRVCWPISNDTRVSTQSEVCSRDAYADPHGFCFRPQNSEVENTDGCFFPRLARPQCFLSNFCRGESLVLGEMLSLQQLQSHFGQLFCIPELAFLPKMPKFVLLLKTALPLPRKTCFAVEKTVKTWKLVLPLKTPAKNLLAAENLFCLRCRKNCENRTLDHPRKTCFAAKKTAKTWKLDLPLKTCFAAEKTVKTWKLVLPLKTCFAAENFTFTASNFWIFSDQKRASGSWRKLQPRSWPKLQPPGLLRRHLLQLNEKTSSSSSSSWRKLHHHKENFTVDEKRSAWGKL